MSTRHPLVNITEWRKGCSCATPGRPTECQQCTDALITAVEDWFVERGAELNSDLAVTQAQQKLLQFDRVKPQLDALTQYMSEKCLGTWGEDTLVSALSVVRKTRALEAKLYAADDQVEGLQELMKCGDKALANAQAAIADRDALLKDIIQGVNHHGWQIGTTVHQSIRRLLCQHETWLGDSGTGHVFCADCGVPRG